MSIPHILIAVVVTFTMGSATARTAEIYAPPQIILAPAADASAQQVRNRIMVAAQGLGWQVLKDEPGRLELFFDKQGKHQVTIAVLYAATAYQIEYVNSINLNFTDADGTHRIHPNYNRWIRNLIKQIGVV